VPLDEIPNKTAAEIRPLVSSWLVEVEFMVKVAGIGAEAEVEAEAETKGFETAFSPGPGTEVEVAEGDGENFDEEGELPGKRRDIQTSRSVEPENSK
jgi:hypothetical protein